MEHRTSKDDLVPPWYKRGAYLLILVVIVFIAVYAIYLLASPHAAATSTTIPADANPYSEGVNP